MLGRMSHEPSYAAPVAVGEVMAAARFIAFEASGIRFSAGTWCGYSGWQDYAL